MKRAVHETCPYLDTVNRAVLDFDFDKVCSVTLHQLNVYACLVCGRFLQGRSPGTPARLHALQDHHHVFLHLARKTVHCLPDDYLVDDPSLADIIYLLDPIFAQPDIDALDSSTQMSLALDGTPFIPGIVGLNDIKLNDSLNCVIMSLAHVRALRDFFLVPANYSNCSSALVRAFGEFVRKVWNRRNFKPQVSPHTLLQAVSIASNNRFSIGQQADPAQFLAWLLNEMRQDVAAKPIIEQCFQGRVCVVTERDVRTDAQKEQGVAPVINKTQAECPFLYLTLDLPAAPLFREDSERAIIPQVPLMVLLNKFDGQTWTAVPAELTRKTYHLTSLPPFVVLLVNRFLKNRFFVEKNPTIVTFPVKSLDLAPYVEGSTGPLKYDLVSSIRHHGAHASGKYIVAVHAKAHACWYEIDSLVVEETHPQKISLSETHLLIFERAQ